MKEKSEQEKINFRYFADGGIGISLDETVSDKDLYDIVAVFSEVTGKKASAPTSKNGGKILPALRRTSAYLTHPVFNTHHSETQVMRYLKQLENKDLGLNTSNDFARLLHDEIERGE